MRELIRENASFFAREREVDSTPTVAENDIWSKRPVRICEGTTESGVSQPKTGRGREGYAERVMVVAGAVSQLYLASKLTCALGASRLNGTGLGDDCRGAPVALPVPAVKCATSKFLNRAAQP